VVGGWVWNFFTCSFRSLFCCVNAAISSSIVSYFSVTAISLKWFTAHS
jgi:hypothetical protein